MKSLLAWMVAGFLSVVPAIAAEPLTVAVNNNDRPFGWTNERGELTGFTVDIARALCKAMDRDCRLQPAVFADFIPGIVAGRFDFVVANILRTPEREKQVDFSNRFWRSSSTFVGRPGVVKAITRDDLRGKRVAVQKGAVQERYLRELYGDAMVIDTYATNVERNAALAAGRADLMLGSTLSHFSFLTTREGEQFEIIGEPIYDHGLGGDVAIPLAKGRDDLRQAINAGMATILRDGTYARINNQYFPSGVF
jgi:polar amino acid transport system substrate-binding protein